MPLHDDLAFAIDLARRAGKVILEHYGKVERLTKTHAATTDEAVTEADRAAQRVVVAGIRERFPNDGIVGEESDTGTSITFDCSNVHGRNWVVDPIDGTNNFIAGVGMFAVAIGLLDDGMPVLGVVYEVAIDRMYAAAKGLGCTVNGRPVRVREDALNDGSVLMLTSNLIGKDGKCPLWPKRWLDQTTWKIRILGSAALEAARVADGSAYGAITVNGKLWDVAAPAALVIEAGGQVVNLDGSNLFPYDLTNYAGAKVPFVAAGPKALPELLADIANDR